MSFGSCPLHSPLLGVFRVCVTIMVTSQRQVVKIATLVIGEHTWDTMSIQVTRYADPPMLSAPIYTWIGGATQPRLTRRHNPLRRLPREMILRVAHFAYSPAYRASWDHPSLDTTDAQGREAVEVDVTNYVDAQHYAAAYLRMTRPIRRRVTYVEVEFSSAWYGSRVQLEG